jgi:hypothetical protein
MRGETNECAKVHYNLLGPVIRNNYLEWVGMNSTFMQTVFIFYPVSMTFAHTWALHYISTYDWVKTGWLRKLTRTILGAAVYYVLYIGRHFLIITETNIKLEFIIRLTCVALIPFVVFGVLPILFNYLGLVKRAEEATTENSRD